jgi:FlaA1/EpsC-like NDP-sugar epimerase
MPVARIADLAAVMIEELAPTHGFTPAQISVQVIGTKLGEKLYEELMNDEETRRTVELRDYFVVLPGFKPVYETIEYTYPDATHRAVERPYNSSLEPAMTREALRSYLLENRLIERNGAPCVS